MKLIIEIPDFSTGVEMEANLNKAINELGSALKKRGVCEMELVGIDADNDLKHLYNVTISK